MNDLLSPEYNFAEPWLGEPDDGAERGDTRVTLPPDLLAELLWQSAFQQLEPLRRGDERAWDVCRQQLVRLGRLEERTGVAVPEQRLTTLRAACDLHDPSRAEGRRSVAARTWVVPLRRTADALGEGEERLHALLLLAELQADVAPDEATRILCEAEHEAIGRRGGTLSRLSIGRRLAEHLFRTGDVEGASREIERLRTLVRRKSRDDARLQLQQARIWLHGGQPGRARTWALAAAELADGNLRATAWLIAARTCLEDRDPEAALRSAADLGHWPRVSVRAPGLERWLPAELASLRAEAQGMRERIGAVFDELDMADQFSTPTSGSSLRRLLSTRLAVELRVKRDLKQAETTLERVSTALIGGTDFTSLTLRLQFVEWLQLRGDGEAAANAVRAIADDLQRDGAPPGHHVRVALEGLVLCDEDTERHLNVLVRKLAQVRPFAARVAMLGELHRVPPLPDGAGRELQALVGEPADGHAAALRLVEVARVCGRRGEAIEALEKIHGGGPLVDADWIRAAARLGLPGKMLDRALGLATRLEKREPGLASASALAIAGAVLDGSDRSRHFAVEQALSLADRALEPEARNSGAGARLAELRERLLPGTTQGALGRYERLGDVRGAERVRSPQPAPSHEVVLSTKGLPGRLRKLLDESRTEASFRIAERLDTDWRELGEELRQYLERVSGRQGGPDLRVVVDDLTAHAMPWELALAAADGWPLSLVRTRRTVTERPRSEGPQTTPCAVVIAPATMLEDLAGRGSMDWTDLALRAYEDAGLPSVEVRPSTEYLELPRRDRPTVVHVRAPIVLEHGGPALDLGGGSTERALHASEAGLRAMHAPSFARVLRASLGKAGPVVVVLDPPTPRSGFEVANQICLLNVFAGALFDSDLVDAVLCLGVTTDLRVAAYETLPELLRSGGPLGRSVSELRGFLAHEGGDELTALTAAAIACFAADPELRLSRTGRE